MKTSFSEYYRPTNSEYKRLWDSALIVIDTNVLLDLYRMPESSREQIFTIFDAFKDRLWVPHHVALEFQRGRTSVMANQKKQTNSALELVDNMVSGLTKAINDLELDKRQVDIKTDALLDNLNKVSVEIISAIKLAQKNQLSISSEDPIRDRLDTIFSGKVGGGPLTQIELESLILEGDERYQNKVPPGFKDDTKGKDPNVASFHHGSIKYPRKFGDLILWRQIIDYVKKINSKEVLLITSEQKEDWWWREGGEIWGPLPALLKEIRQEGGVELFWMYSPSQFAEQANKYASTNTTPEVVADLEEVARNRLNSFTQGMQIPRRELRDVESLQKMMHVKPLARRRDHRDSEFAVFEWLRDRFGEAYPTYGFPDFLSKSEFGFHGFEVKDCRYPRRWQNIELSIRDALHRGNLRIMDGDLSRFTLILILSSERDIFNGDEESVDQLMRMRKHFEILLGNHRESDIVVGSIVEGEFRVIYRLEGRFSSGNSGEM